MGREVKTWRTTSMVVSFLILFFTISWLWLKEWTKSQNCGQEQKQEKPHFLVWGLEKSTPMSYKVWRELFPLPFFFSPSPTLKPVAAELPLCQWWWRYMHMKVPGNNLSLPEELKQGPLWSEEFGGNPITYISSLFCFTLWASQAMQSVWQCEKLTL